MIHVIILLLFFVGAYCDLSLVFVFCCVFVFQLSVLYFVSCLMAVFLHTVCRCVGCVFQLCSFTSVAVACLWVGTDLFCSVTSFLLPTVSVDCILQGFAP
jgi:hypothetical protein